MKLAVTLRKTDSEKAYIYAREAETLLPLNEEPALRTFTHWKLIDNRFPYDAVYKTHHMLIPKRGFQNRTSMALAELAELQRILASYEGAYDVIFENMASKRSIQNLFHLHLACYVDSREELCL